MATREDSDTGPMIGVSRSVVRAASKRRGVRQEESHITQSNKRRRETFDVRHD